MQSEPTSQPVEHSAQKVEAPQEEQLTKELVDQLIELLQDPKVEVKHGSLSAILQYTKSESAKIKFKGTSLFEQLMKNLFVPQLTKICLSALIHFSSLEQFGPEFVTFIQPIILALKQWTDLLEELGLLFLINATKYESVIARLVTEKQESKINEELQTLCGFMETKPTRKWVIVNIFVNITSVEQGRKYICEIKLYLKFIKHLEAYIQSTRVGVLKLLRNCSFEWESEEFIKEFLSPEHDIINRIAEFMITLIIAAKLSPNTPQEDLEKVLKCYLGKERTIQSKQLGLVESGSKERALSEITLAIEIILVLSNSNFAERKPPIKQEPLKEILSILKFSDLTEEYKDKLEAIQIFCFH